MSTSGQFSMLASGLSAILDFALPVRCAGCGAIISDQGRFCATCWSDLDFLTGEGCARCGSPKVEPGLVCAPCIAVPPRHKGVRAVVAYGDVSSRLAISLKHGRKIGLAKTLGKLMSSMAKDEKALLVPVPLHRLRIWERGFNQSLLIAKAIANQTSNQVEPDCLIRTKATPKLGGLGRDQRRKVLTGAIKVRPEQRPLIRDRHIYLVDDVYTSGATANACTSALLRGGARDVTILCWARVVDRGDD
jgi:ComF family protein